MSSHSTAWSAPDEQLLAQTLNELELVRLGEFVWESTVRLVKHALPPEVAGADAFRIPWPLVPANFLPLGNSVREAYFRAGASGRSRAPWHEGGLFWEAITEAIAFLHDERKNRITHVDEQGEHSDPAPPPRAVPLDYMAKYIIEGAHAPARTPTREELESRVDFALTLDPLCAEAYHIQGQLEEGKSNFHRARIAYELAMKIAALLIGPQAVASAETSRAQNVDFWSASDAARAYIRARATLARLLWSKLDDPRGASALLQGLISLDPGDHLGTRHALLCCLLEAGETATLGVTLTRLYFEAYGYDYEEDEEEAIPEEDMPDTWWLYTRACYLYCIASMHDQNEWAFEKAVLALSSAFHANSYIPHRLLAEGSPPEPSDDADSSPGTPGEAFVYTDMALPAWRKTPGALEWLKRMLSQLEG